MERSKNKNYLDDVIARFYKGDTYLNEDLLEVYGLYTKLLIDPQEREEFDQVCKETFLKKTGQSIPCPEEVYFPLEDLDYFAVCDTKHRIVGGCKLANSQGLKYSNSETGHKFLIDSIDEVDNTNFNISQYMQEGDVYSEIDRGFVVDDNKHVSYVLAEGLFMLFGEQGVDYAFALTGSASTRLINSRFAKVEELGDKPVISPYDNEACYLIRIHHPTNRFLKDCSEQVLKAGLGLPNWFQNKFGFDI